MIFSKSNFNFFNLFGGNHCECLKMYAIRRYVNFKQFAKFEQYVRLANIGQSSVCDSNRTYYTYSPEPSQPINREPTFCSIEDAVKCVKSGKNKNSSKISFFASFSKHLANGLCIYVGCQNSITVFN